MSTPTVFVHLCGEEGSGKSHALEYLKEKMKDKGIHVLTIEEDTSDFFDDKVKTFDQFCRLSGDERAKRSGKVFVNRIKKEVAIVKYLDDYDGDKPIVILADRPWWDCYYYSLKRDATQPGHELNLFDLLTFTFLNGPPVRYANLMPILMIFCPLSPEILNEAEDKDSRPKKVTKRSGDIIAQRAVDFVNYSQFQLMMQPLLGQMETYPSPALVLFENTTTDLMTENDKSLGLMGLYISYLRALKGLAQTYYKAKKEKDKKVMNSALASIERLMMVDSLEERDGGLDILLGKLEEIVSSVEEQPTSEEDEILKKLLKQGEETIWN